MHYFLHDLNYHHSGLTLVLQLMVVEVVYIVADAVAAVFVVFAAFVVFVAFFAFVELVAFPDQPFVLAIDLHWYCQQHY